MVSTGCLYVFLFLFSGVACVWCRCLDGVVGSVVGLGGGVLEVFWRCFFIVLFFLL